MADDDDINMKEPARPRIRRLGTPRDQYRRDAVEHPAITVKTPLTADQEKILENLTKYSSTFRSNGVSKAVLDGAIGLREEWAPDASVTHYTTSEVLAEEKAILEHADILADTRSYFIERSVVDSVIERYDELCRKLYGAELREEQRKAVRRLTEAEGFAMLSGQAGTGKSVVLMAVHDTYKAARRQVVGLAWTNDVVQQLKDGGFKYANTVTSELNALKGGTAEWDSKTVVIVDEAAMLSNPNARLLLSEAQKAGSKVILAGDDRQLQSIERGGIFSVLRNHHGGAELNEVLRISDPDQEQAFNHMHAGDFEKALQIFSKQKAIHWSETQADAMSDLVDKWARDSLAAPEKKRLAFAYTNADVDKLNTALRKTRREQNRLGEDRPFATSSGRFAFAVGDRLQFTDTVKWLKIYNGRFGTIQKIDKDTITVDEDGGRKVSFNTKAFKNFRHGYAGTIHRGQGKTLHQTYLYHSKRWGAEASYVALTRHSEKTALFVAKQTAKDLPTLARQMERIDDRKAATQFLVDVDDELIRGMQKLNVDWRAEDSRAGDKRKRMSDPVQSEVRDRVDAERPAKRLKPADRAERKSGRENALLANKASRSRANRGLDMRPPARWTVGD